jgi:hypothetical protein
LAFKSYADAAQEPKWFTQSSKSTPKALDKAGMTADVDFLNLTKLCCSRLANSNFRLDNNSKRVVVLCH